MFQAIHDKRVHDLEGIRTVFEEVGVDPMTVLKEWGKQNIIVHKEKMDAAVAHLDIQDVPCIVIRGKHVVKLKHGPEFETSRVVDLIKKLLAEV